MSRRNEAIAIAVLLLLGLLFRGRLGRDWIYAGSDSYAYAALADSLRLEGRYALGPPPAPLSYARMPLYPLFVAALSVGEPRGWSHKGAEQPGYARIRWAQILLDLFGTCLL